jgi:hypothetical protein
VHQSNADALQSRPDAAGYKIRRSARKRVAGETAKPKALAVLTLMTNSNFVARSTGMSAGFAPLTILSTKIARRYSPSRDVDFHSPPKTGDGLGP